MTARKATAPKTESRSLEDLLKDKQNEKDEDVNTSPDSSDEVVENSEEYAEPVPGNTGTNVINKTPADLAAETPDETDARYGHVEGVNDANHNNPNVNADQDMVKFNKEIPAGTHLHPDIKRSLSNANLGGTTESAAVTKTVGQRVYAQEAEVDDKGLKGPKEERNVDNDPVVDEDGNKYAEEYNSEK